MLQQFRDNLKGVTATILVAIIIIPFALWGVESIFVSGSAVETAATVEGEKITELDVTRRIELRRRAILNQFQDIDPQMLEDASLRAPVLDEMVGQKVLYTTARDGGMAVPDQTFNEMILSSESFQVNGRFNRDLYASQLSQLGLTPLDYRRVVTEELLANQVTLGIQLSGVVVEPQMARFQDVVLQKRSYQYLTLDVSEFMKDIVISDPEIVDYYEAHADEFAEPDKVIVDYIEINPEIVSRFVKVSDEEVRERFEAEKKAGLESGQSWHIAHILVADDEGLSIAELQEKLANGEAFDDLARAHSDDFGSAATGGDLGTFTSGSLPNGFEEAVQSIEVGEVSEPVKTESGTHLIKLLDRQESTELVYGDVKERIENELRAGRAEETLATYVERLKDETYTAESLVDAAEKLGLTASESQPFSKQGGTGIAADPRVVAAAFSEDIFEHGYPSEVLDLGENRYIVIKVKEVLPAHQVPLEKAREEIVAQLTDEKAKAIARDKAASLVDKLDAGASIDELAAEGGWGHATVSSATRFEAGGRTQLLEAVFEYPSTASLPVAGTVEAGSEVLVYSLTEIASGNSERLSGDEQRSMQRSLEARLSSREFMAYMEAEKSAAEIKVKK